MDEDIWKSLAFETMQVKILSEIGNQGKAFELLLQ